MSKLEKIKMFEYCSAKIENLSNQLCINIDKYTNVGKFFVQNIQIVVRLLGLTLLLSSLAKIGSGSRIELGLKLAKNSEMKMLNLRSIFDAIIM